MAKRTFISTRLLQDGMKIDQAILDGSGRKLICRGAILDEYMISSMRRMGISGVYIGDGKEEPVEKKKEEKPKISQAAQKKIETATVADRAKVKLTESVKSRVKEGILFLYNNTESPDFAEATTSIADGLMKAIMENDAIAVDVDALKISDEYTFKHSVDVATMAMVIAKKHGLSEKAVYEVGVAGLLHDIGKTKIPNEVLNKPDRLTDSEFEIMKQHALYGYRILQEKQEISDAIRYGVLQHHEKMNGRGYPLGVPGENISLYAKFISVADIYDALVTERPYKKAFSKRDAVEMIMSMTDELDIGVMRSFLASVILYPVGSIVELSNGEKAQVVENNHEYVLRPTVVGLDSGNSYNLSSDLKCASLVIR